mgnify:CR=1 FL=1
MNFSLYKIISILIISLFLLLLVGCEDDPLLDPNTETGEDKGSYGKLSLPSSHDIEKKSNPEIF